MFDTELLWIKLPLLLLVIIKIIIIPVKSRATLPLTIALSVSPAPSAFPTRTEVAALMATGICSEPAAEIRVKYCH